MQYRIEVIHKKEANDPEGLHALSEARDLGIKGIESVHAIHVYIVEGNLTEDDVVYLTEHLFYDPVVQTYRICGVEDVSWPHVDGKTAHTIEIARRQGVMDPVQQSALKGAADLGLAEKVGGIRTARKYVFKGELDHSELELIAMKSLANKTIEEIHIDEPDVNYSFRSQDYEFELKHIPIRDADDDRLVQISREGMLSLTLEEMETIQRHFRDQGREPTDLELEILAQTWSEHCVHKTLKGHVTYEGPIPEGWEDYQDAEGRLVIDNLLKETIARATKELDKPWCLSVFEDNAGIIEFDESNGICFKVETHNHPSAIEPYGGANTGIGGVIRDPLGTGLGAKPIMNTDVFCFGPPDMDDSDVPEGALHPKRVLKGVVSGVRDYGNRMGIPTANGAVYFDKRYTGNCLVYCGNIGMIPKDKIEKAPNPGDYVVVVGGRTGRDGIHGATFSSIELTSESEDVSSGAVQIGNPITEKKVVDTLLKARDDDLYDCVTDCGAGGLSSAVGEMGAETGVEAEIGDVPLKYDGLSYTEIWISEAQERMVISVPPENIDKIMELFESEDVEATVIGTFTGDGVLHVKYNGEDVAELDMEFLHEGLPRFQETASWKPPRHPDPILQKEDKSDQKLSSCLLEKGINLGECLKKILAAPNVRSKEWIIRQYDHEVQGQTVIKPLVGTENDGPGDATIITPILGSNTGAVVACGMNPKYGDIDTYHSAASAIDEALRNIVAVGGAPGQTAILDNFCWGNTRKPGQLGTLVRASLACYDIAKGFGIPFISGKDSLNNEFKVGDKTIAIPPTLLISAISVMEDVTRARSMDIKKPGNHIYIVGNTHPELGASHYYELCGLTGRTVPQVRIQVAKKTMEAVHAAIQAKTVESCHDLSEGGLAVAAAEMAFAGGIGMELDLKAVPYIGDKRYQKDDVLLFSESNSRFLVEVKPSDAELFEKTLGDVPMARIGESVEAQKLVINGLTTDAIVSETLDALKGAWQTPLFS